MTTPPPDHLNTISPHALHLIQTLNLQYLPLESGYIGLLGTSSQTVTTSSNVQLAAQSHNYYMLTSALPLNYLHWLEPDDTHILIEGGPVEYFIFHPPSSSRSSTSSSQATPPRAERIVLGRDYDKGQTAMVSVPGGCWKALRLCVAQGAEYALMANVLAPEFTGDRVRIGEGREWVDMFTGKAKWATEECLRELVGPNWKDKEEEDVVVGGVVGGDASRRAREYLEV